jgi:hypothetical protein
MQTQNTKMGIDFTGQNIYLGIDTHYKTWMVSIYGFYLLNIGVKRKYRETPAFNKI